MNEYTPRHSRHHHEDSHETQQSTRRDDEPAVGFDPEHLPPQPSIWVATGSEAMTGQWIDATLDPDQLKVALDGRDIYDSIGFGDFHFRPGDNPQLISTIARGIREYGEPFAYWAHLHDGDPGMLASFEDAYLGDYATPADWALAITDAQNILNELRLDIGDLVEFFHFDADAFVENAVDDGHVWIERRDDGRCWVFRTT
ncbi:antirestriction protein ArdA [Rudaeicoccus suwonensis]|uniref:Antirestriction protein ArdA n=1 Tax=Rudaeicoccus suwonensis TaxID=657409 RepID=A0A561EAD6_9MICO|nr:antirestriction protein ArdA [Rudaeicoccus suwonensis]TWE12570.1 antirestriction protein ArdA [Rudaeicoccus suwonensis]